MSVRVGSGDDEGMSKGGTNEKRMRLGAGGLGAVGGVADGARGGGVATLAQDHDLDMPSQRELRMPRTCRMEYWCS